MILFQFLFKLKSPFLEATFFSQIHHKGSHTNLYRIQLLYYLQIQSVRYQDTNPVNLHFP